jgi:hypothetical protein
MHIRSGPKPESYFRAGAQDISIPERRVQVKPVHIFASEENMPLPSRMIERLKSVDEQYQESVSARDPWHLYFLRLTLKRIPMPRGFFLGKIFLRGGLWDVLQRIGPPSIHLSMRMK